MIHVVYAVDTAVLPGPAGGTVRVAKGQHWPADDPMVRAHPALFSEDPRWGMVYTLEPAGYGDPPVEQTTKNPGERREVRRVS